MRSEELTERFFIDTNVIIYCFDSSIPSKRKKAIGLIDYALSSGLGVISHQVIQEFASVALTKFRKVFTADKLIMYFDEVLFPLWRAYPNREAYIAAVEFQARLGLSWWDSLIVAAALECGCSFLVSEDLSPGQRIRNLEVVNPFS